MLNAPEQPQVSPGDTGRTVYGMLGAPELKYQALNPLFSEFFGGFLEVLEQKAHKNFKST